MKKYLEFIEEENKRQQNTINLIASENYVSKDVMDALGSGFVNKYAEGYSEKRYYAGNEIIDKVEDWAKDTALQMFKLGDDWRVNVQPYSGSPANIAIYMGLLNTGDKIVSMKLQHGGHLTHGHNISASGILYDFEHYGVDENGVIDYEQLSKVVLEHKPKMVVAGASSYVREIDFEKIGVIAKKAGAIFMADISHISGLIVAGLHQTCFDSADVVMTTTHKTLRGPRGAIIFSRKEYSKDIDRAVFPGVQGGPHMNSILSKAVAFEEAMKDEFIEYQKNVLSNSKVLASSLMENNIDIASGGTDNHIVLIDLSKFEIGGKEVEEALEKIGIIVNKNVIANDKRSPMDPSGIRIGTPAMTSRGMGEKEMKKIAQMISETIVDLSKKESGYLNMVDEVKALANEFTIN